MALRERLKFLLQTMTDQLIPVSFYNYVLAYPVYRNTKLLLKGNLPTAELVC